MSSLYNDPGTEAEALSDWIEGAIEEENEEERYERLRYENQAHRLKRRGSPTKKYTSAKKAPVGSVVRCPVCGRSFKKKSYQQAFCSNKGRGNCKDKYWNP